MTDQEAERIYKTLERIRAVQQEIALDRIHYANRTIEAYSRELNATASTLKDIMKDYAPMTFEDDELIDSDFEEVKKEEAA